MLIPATLSIYVFLGLFCNYFGALLGGALGWYMGKCIMEKICARTP